MKKYMSWVAPSCAVVALSVFSNPASADKYNMYSGYPTDVPKLGKATDSAVVSTQPQFQYSLITLGIGGEASMKYNDNVFKSSTDEQGDLITTFQPKVSLTTNLQDHELELTASTEIGRYLTEQKANYTDYNIGANGRLDLTDTDALYLKAQYHRDHVEIGSSDEDLTQTLAEPVEYDVYDTGAIWKGLQGAFHYELGGNFTSYEYDDSKREDNTISIQSDRDRDVTDATAKIGYEFIPSYVFYAKAGVNDRSYDNRIDSSAVYPRDSDGYLVALGASNEHIKSDMVFDTYLGYMHQNYDASQLKDVGALAAGIDATLMLTPADQIKLSLDRTINDTTLDGVSSNLQTKFGIDAKHQYTEQIAVGANVGYTKRNYQTNLALASEDRDDDVYDAGIRAEYAFTPDVNFNVEYDYRDRRSNIDTYDYDAHTVGMSVRVKY